MPHIRVGCTGWGYDDWVGSFYPPGAPPSEYLERYARVFDLVEVDSSFYHAPTAPTTRRWANSVPPGFLFSVKIPREVTHQPRPAEPRERVRTFLEGVEPLRAADKLGPVVAQFPSSFRRSLANAEWLERFLRSIPPEYRLGVELRHASWWARETWDALASRGAALVWSVLPEIDPPAVTPGEFVYVRFVGDRALTKFDRIQRENPTEMEAMRRRLQDEGLTAREIFVLLNNHYLGFGPGTAVRMQEMLGLPPADLSAASRIAGQTTLF